MKLFLSILLFSSVASASSRFCVLSHSKEKINWLLADDRGAVTHLVRDNDSRPILCAEDLNPNVKYALSIYSQNKGECRFSAVNPGDFVVVNLDSKENIQCDYQSDEGNVAQVEKPSDKVLKTQLPAGWKFSAEDIVYFLMGHPLLFSWVNEVTKTDLHTRPYAASYIENFGKDIAFGMHRLAPVSVADNFRITANPVELALYNLWININILGNDGTKFGILTVGIKDYVFIYEYQRLSGPCMRLGLDPTNKSSRAIIFSDCEFDPSN